MSGCHPFLPLGLPFPSTPSRSRRMAIRGPLRSEDWISRQTLRDGLSEPLGGLVGLGCVSSGKVSPNAFANEPDRQVRQRCDFMLLEPSPAVAAIIGRIFESHA